MIPLPPPFRPATPADAHELAELVFMAGEGMPLHVWAALAVPGQDPWDIGRARQAEKAAEGQIVVADVEGRAVAGLTGYVIGPEPEEITDDIPALFRPLIELENLAPNTWYVNVLATYPEHRGKGFGKSLLDIAEEIARAEGQTAMSLIVSAENDTARRLYARQGYREIATRPCDPGDWQTETTEWVLIGKPLG